MSDEQAERTPTDTFLEALDVRRNATVGLLVGVLVAAMVYAYFVVVPTVLPALPATRQPPVWYLLLAGIFALALGLVVALVLTIGSAIRLARGDRDDRENA